MPIAKRPFFGNTAAGSASISALLFFAHDMAYAPARSFGFMHRPFVDARSSWARRISALDFGLAVLK